MVRARRKAEVPLRESSPREEVIYQSIFEGGMAFLPATTILHHHASSNYCPPEEAAPIDFRLEQRNTSGVELANLGGENSSSRGRARACNSFSGAIPTRRWCSQPALFAPFLPALRLRATHHRRASERRGASSPRQKGLPRSSSSCSLPSFRLLLLLYLRACAAPEHDLRMRASLFSLSPLFSRRYHLERGGGRREASKRESACFFHLIYWDSRARRAPSQRGICSPA